MQALQHGQELVQPSPLRRQPELERQQLAIRKQRLSPKLLDDSRFIDPAAEAALVLPQQALAQPLFSPSQAAPSIFSQPQAPLQKPSLLAALYSQLAAFLSWLKTAFKKSRRERARLTKAGKAALEQLRYLSLLCEATEVRTPEEALAAESAFGEAYYEIMQLSANLMRMSEREQEHHHRRYAKHIASILRALD